MNRAESILIRAKAELSATHDGDCTRCHHRAASHAPGGGSCELCLCPALSNLPPPPLVRAEYPISPAFDPRTR